MRAVKNLPQKARFLALAGDQSRLRVMCLLFSRRDICVSDIAAKLGVSVAAVSHHLRLLRDNGLVRAKREKNNICYTLVGNAFTRNLKRLMCD